MEELQKAIENITYYSKKFPKEDLELISANREAAIPYLREAVEKAVREGDDLDQKYNLHFYSIFLLAQFQDREFFPKMMELACLPEETLDFLIGDVLTEDLKNILYNTYNGEIELLRQSVMNKEASDYARSAMLSAMGQLYLDNTLEKQELQDFLKEIIYGEDSIGDYIYTAVADRICQCHFTEMLPDLRHLYQDLRVDEGAIGGYDACVDRIFRYRSEQRLCRTSDEMLTRLRGWAMFEQPDEEDEDDSAEDMMDRAFSRMIDQIGKTEPRKSVKIGRNDPCPCGSGKKYKQCCLNKPREMGTESREEQEKWLKGYPEAAAERVEGRVYLEDLYSSESIEIDKLLYLALRHRAIPIWNRESDTVVAKRKARYLTDAYRKFQEIVAREHIQRFSEYDSKYSIHYPCVEWIGELTGLLEEDDSEGILKEVRKTYQDMGKE